MSAELPCVVGDAALVAIELLDGKEDEPTYFQWASHAEKCEQCKQWAVNVVGVRLAAGDGVLRAYRRSRAR